METLIGQIGHVDAILAQVRGRVVGGEPVRSALPKTPTCLDAKSVGLDAEVIATANQLSGGGAAVGMLPIHSGRQHVPTAA